MAACHDSLPVIAVGSAFATSKRAACERSLTVSPSDFYNPISPRRVKLKIEEEIPCQT